MMRLFRDAVARLREDGFGALLWRSYYLFVFPRLPQKAGDEQRLNGVLVRNSDARWLDKLVGQRYYEEHEVELLAKHGRSGDTIIDVGAGLGVTTVHAARVAGPNGTVIAYEASEQSADQVRRTVEENPTNAEVRVEHAVVGTAKSVRYDQGDRADVLDPADLPTCDVLMLDCEGAELEIIEGMSIEPRVIIVETHAQYDAPADAVTAALTDRGTT